MQSFPIQVQEAIDISNSVIFLENKINGIYKAIKQSKPYMQQFTLKKISLCTNYYTELLALMARFNAKYHFVISFYPEHLKNVINVNNPIHKRKKITV